MYRLRILNYTIFKRVLLLLIISLKFSTTAYADKELTFFESNSWSFLIEMEDQFIIEEDENIPEDSNYFVVTAYYSPLPNQDKYITGTYEWDIRLNGGWIHGASWEKVFPWMLAAPKSYPFWTRIYLEGYGVGSVEDRGGAIVPAWERGYTHDRIDIWMWSGDEGMQRAINWGKRKIPGYKVDNSEKVTLALKSSLEDLYLTLKVWPESDSADVMKLQQFLIEIWMYNGKITGNYNDVHAIILKYQFDKGLIKSESDWGAGYFGPKMVSTLKEDLWVSLRKENYLTKKERDKVLKLKTTITSIIKSRNYEKIEEARFLLNLKSKITKLIDKSDNRKLKLKLEYFKSII